MDDAPGYVASRTCTVVDEREPPRDSGRQAPLTDYADTAAYVLIAEPGAGKTTAFETEAAKQGAVCVTVRNFLRFDKPEWRDATLFLDGLDESRAGPGDRRTPLDGIVKKLAGLGCPPFRLSCRWSFWLAANDKKGLREVSPDGTVTVVRLDPLSKRNIKDILVKNHGVEDAAAFVAAARERGVDGLLSNPQNLELLAKSVARGKWPNSRKETFEQACRMLVHEPNGEHRVANPSAAATDPFIEAAGRLCAVQLLAGNAGYTLPDRAKPDDDYPSLAEVDGDLQGKAGQVLGTRLFVGVSEGRLAAAHRQIAEFLAARHVSGLLDGGLPLERVLALITGFDGELLPEFHNFASWLAVHNKRSRRRLIRLHPSGLIYDGDRETYSPDEKREIVLNLRREWARNAWCSRSSGRVPGFGGIVSPELEDTLREILSDGERGLAHQCYVLLLMQMLADGDPLPTLSDLLEEMVRDATWYPSVRCTALEVLTGYSEQGRLGSASLATMVRDIDGGSIDNPDDALLGILLKSLYPRVLTMTEVRTLLREPKYKASIGEYSKFWTDHVPRESTPEQLAELLDGIAASFEDCRTFMTGKVGTYTRMARLPVEALEQVLRDTRGHVAPDRLYNWLGMFSDNGLQVLDKDIASLRFRLEWDAETLKALIAHAVDTCLASGEDCADVVDRRLFGARPFRYGHWCMEKALAAGKPEAASFYLRELFDCVTDGQRASGLTVEGARADLAADQALLRQFDRMSEHPTGSESRPEDGTKAESPQEPSERPRGRAQVAGLSSASKTPRVGPQLLHQAAESYLGIAGQPAGRTPRERLTDFAGRSLQPADVLLAEIEGTIGREDLPDSDDVVRLFDEGKVNLLVLPFAAGLHSLEQSGRLSVSDLNEDQIRLAVTILYTLPRQLVDPDSMDGTGTYRPEWFRAVLRDDPALLADVLCRTVARKLETGVQLATELHELWGAEDHREVAGLATLPVLKRFPPAETDAALQALCWSLHAALAGRDWTEVGRVVAERLDRGGQSPGERSCWLMAGFFMDPERWRDDLQFLTEDEVSLKWLGMFLAAGRVSRDDLARRLKPPDIEPLVIASGAALRRHGLPELAYRAVSDLISTLRDNPSASATAALEALGNAADAKPWLPVIAGAGEHQARKRREQEYRHCDTRQVVQTLDKGSPANAGDLAALVFDELTDLSKRIRDGSTSDWRLYWNVNSHNRPTKPKPENACRDAVLSILQERLVRLGVDAQPEVIVAEDKRADIRASFDGFNVPVEIKRSCHGDLWTAVREQLIADYTRSPGASGFGIYLVFWFGDIPSCRPTKRGDWRPKTATEVRQKLEEALSDREKGLISICVVDVSVPPRKRQAQAAAPVVG